MNGQNWYYGYEDRQRVNRAIAEEVRRNRQADMAVAGRPRFLLAVWLGRQLTRLGAALEQHASPEVPRRNTTQPVNEWTR